MNDDTQRSVNIPPGLHFGVFVGAPPDKPCPCCCDWRLPLARGSLAIPMKYQDWLVWHLHVVLHQNAMAFDDAMGMVS